jgi:FixJ family two-component response regulator
MDQLLGSFGPPIIDARAVKTRLHGLEASAERRAMPDLDDSQVILIEDDPSMCQALVRILRLGGFVPVPYGSAEAFLLETRDAAALCMIIDVRLPGMDGFGLHERLMARTSVPPAIFITAFEGPGARAQAARTGALLLSKPFSGRELLEAIRTIGRKGPPGMPAT